MEYQNKCPICDDLGWITADVPVGHPMFGKLVPCPHREAETTRSVSQKLWDALGPLKRMTIDNFLPDGHAVTDEQRSSLRNAYEGVRRFIDEPKNWLLIQGNYGCGKTHLAAAIANSCLVKGLPTLFINTPDLFDYLRAAYNPSVEDSFDARFAEVRDIPVLILDDFGTQNATPWVSEKMYQILNSRYVSKKTTVITTNLEVDDFDPRLSSRFSDLDLVRKLVIVAPDYRRSALEHGQSSMSSLGWYHDMTFSTFDLRQRPGDITSEQQENLREALRVAKDFAQNPRDWLVFTGDYGCGKTHLAAAIANYRAERGYSVMFVVVPDLLDHLRSAFSPDSRAPLFQRFEEVRTSPLLVLDDLGTESATPWAKEKLYQLFNFRHSARLPTVITTALRPTELDARIQTRILDVSRCEIFPVKAPSYSGVVRMTLEQARQESQPKKQSGRSRSRY